MHDQAQVVDHFRPWTTLTRSAGGRAGNAPAKEQMQMHKKQMQMQIMQRANANAKSPGCKCNRG